MKVSYYPVDGKPFPGVTTILDIGLGTPQFLIDWAVKQGALKLLKTWKEKKGALNQFDAISVAKSARFDTLKVAQARGIAVHSFAESALNKTPNTYEICPPDYNNYYSSLSDWLLDNPITPIFQERFVLNRLVEYAGRLDLYAEFQGKKALLDFKTSNHQKAEHGLQLAAYAECLKQSGYPVELMGCIYIQEQKDGSVITSFREYNEPFEMFLTVKKVFDWKLAHEQQIEWNERMKPEQVAAELTTK
jgi:hypothetical protein